MGKHTHARYTFTKTRGQQHSLVSAGSFFIYFIISFTIESPAVNSLYLHHRSFFARSPFITDHCEVCYVFFGNGWWHLLRCLCPRCVKDSVVQELVYFRLSWQEAFWCLFTLWEVWLTPHLFSSLVALRWNISLHGSVTEPPVAGNFW